MLLKSIFLSNSSNNDYEVRHEALSESDMRYQAINLFSLAYRFNKELREQVVYKICRESGFLAFSRASRLM